MRGRVARVKGFGDESFAVVRIDHPPDPPHFVQFTVDDNIETHALMDMLAAEARGRSQDAIRNPGDLAALEV